MMEPINQAAPAGQPPEASGITVCITANADGSFTVYLEGTGDDNRAQADSMDDALNQAAQMLEQPAPAAGQDGAQDNEQANELFGAGFNQARGRAA